MIGRMDPKDRKTEMEAIVWEGSCVGLDGHKRKTIHRKRLDSEAFTKYM